MPLSTSSLVLAIALSTGATEPASVATASEPLVSAPVVTLASSVPATGSLRNAPLTIKAGDDRTPTWMTDRTMARPAALPAMYATLGALHAMDLYSTRKALNAGATEMNPVMRKAAGNNGAMLAVKALSTAGSIYFTERAWKKNRKGAVVIMAIVNGVTAAVVANNMKNAR
jgi:Domain of unknown function (DUF5658)